MRLESYVQGRWIAPGGDWTGIRSAVTGAVVAEVGGGRLDMAEVLDHARRVGGPNLRRLTFHQRAEMPGTGSTPCRTRPARPAPTT